MSVSAKITRATQAFRDYYSLGASRSLACLQQVYGERAAAGDYTPTQSLDTLESWSRQFAWQKQVELMEQMAAQEFARRNANRIADSMVQAEEQGRAGAIYLKRLAEVAQEKGLDDLDLARKTTKIIEKDGDTTRITESELPAILDYANMALKAITDGLRNLKLLEAADGMTPPVSVTTNIYNDLRSMSKEELRLERDRLMRQLGVKLVRDIAIPGE